MEPLNPNMGSLPGTVLQGGPGALEVGMARMKQEGDMAIALAKGRLDAKKEKDAALAKKLNMEIKPVMDAHWDEYNNAIANMQNRTAELLKAQQADPLNPAYDVDNPSSAAAREISALQRGIEEYQHVSGGKEAALAEDMKKYASGDLSQRDMAELFKYYSAPVKDHISGKMIPPVRLGNYEYQKVYNDIVTGLQTDKTAYASADGEGYQYEGSEVFISPERIEQTARNMAANPASLHYEHKRRELEDMKGVNPARYEAIQKAAKEKDMTPEQYSTWEDLKGMGMSQKSRSMRADGTYNNKMGAGWGADAATADRWWRLLSGISNNDSEIMDEMFGTITPMAGGRDESGYRYAVGGTSDEIKGVQVGTFMNDKGHKIPERISALKTGNGEVLVETIRDDGSKGPTLRYSQGDFASEFWEQLVDNNEKFKRAPGYKVAEDKGLIKESGYIKPIGQQKTGVADNILAPSKKGMMD